MVLKKGLKMNPSDPQKLSSEESHRIAREIVEFEFQDPRHMHMSAEMLVEKYAKEIESYASQRECEGRIGELQRISVANSGNGISFWFEDYPSNTGWATMRQYTAWRLEEARNIYSIVAELHNELLTDKEK